MTRPASALAATVMSEGFLANDPDPVATMRSLRDEAPVTWCDGVDGIDGAPKTGGFWVTGSHQLIQQMEVDTATWSSARGILVFEIDNPYDSPPTMMHTDPPDHTRYRSLLQPAFRPSLMRRLEEHMAEIVNEHLDAIDARGASDQPVDIVEHLTVPFPLLVICELLGLPIERWRDAYRWSEASVPGASDMTAEERAATQGEMVNELIAAVAAKANEPGDDVFSILAEAGLTEFEIAMFGVQLLTAGNETTRNSLSGGLWALAHHPDQYAALRADPSLVGSATEEILRYTSAVIYFMRTATREVMLGDTAIAAGDPVVLHYLMANRDPATFTDPEAFDITRSPNPHLAFGHGPHFCIGAALARLEIAVVLRAMTTRYASIEPVGSIGRTRSNIIAGYTSAPLRLTPANAG